MGITVTGSGLNTDFHQLLTLVSLLKTGWLKGTKFSLERKQSQKKKEVNFYSVLYWIFYSNTICFDLTQQLKKFCSETEQEQKNVPSCLLLTFKNPLLVTCCMLVGSWSQTALRTQPLGAGRPAGGLPAHWAETLLVNLTGISWIELGVKPCRSLGFFMFLSKWEEKWPNENPVICNTASWVFLNSTFHTVFWKCTLSTRWRRFLYSGMQKGR